MKFLVTTNRITGKSFYYINGVRASYVTYEAARSVCVSVDSFVTKNTTTHVKQYCYGRKK